MSDVGVATSLLLQLLNPCISMTLIVGGAFASFHTIAFIQLHTVKLVIIIFLYPQPFAYLASRHLYILHIGLAIFFYPKL